MVQGDAPRAVGRGYLPSFFLRRHHHSNGVDGVDCPAWPRSTGRWTNAARPWIFGPRDGTLPGWMVDGRINRTDRIARTAWSSPDGAPSATEAGSWMSTVTGRCPRIRAGCPHGHDSGIPTLRQRITSAYQCSAARARIRRPSIGVDQLPYRGDLAPQLVVHGRLAGDLVARVEDRRMIAPAQLRADPEQ